MAVHGGNIDEISRKYNISSSDIVDFSANINPLGINNKVKEAMILALEKVERYPDITYFNLKNAIGTFENINIKHMVLGNGAAEVIFNIARALKPKKVLLPAPTFSEYEEAVKSVESNIEYYKLKEENEFSMDEGFINKIDETVDMTFICNPNNPTGSLTKKEFIEKLLKKAEKHKVIVVIDESFLDFVEEERLYSAKHLLNQYKNLIIVKSLTKFFAIPGIRIGYGLNCNEHIINKINKVSVPWAINIVAAEGIDVGLKEAGYINDSIKYVKGERNFLYENMQSIKAIKTYKPSVNFIMFKLLKDMDLKEVLLDKGILIRSCNNYQGLGNNFYRIAVRTREENEKFISTMKTVSFDK